MRIQKKLRKEENQGVVAVTQEVEVLAEFVETKGEDWCAAWQLGERGRLGPIAEARPTHPMVQQVVPEFFRPQICNQIKKNSVGHHV